VEKGKKRSERGLAASLRLTVTIENILFAKAREEKRAPGRSRRVFRFGSLEHRAF
jgi:hypothetical protein